MVVYFVQRKSDSAIKIGHTGCFKNRLWALRSELQTQLDVLCVIDGGRPIEKMLHAQFSKIRIEGEWFLPDEILINYINQLAENALDIDKILKERLPGRRLNLVVSDEAGRVLDGIKKRGGFKSLDNAMDSLLLNIEKREESPLARA